MVRTPRCSLPRIITVSLALSAALLAGLSLAENAEADAAAIATSESMDDREADSGDLESQTVEAEDPDTMTVGAGSLEEREAQAGDPDDDVAEAGQLESRTVTSESLSDLSQAAPDQGIESLEIPGRADWDDATDPAVVVARKRLVRAQARATAARAAYAEMIERNYPRGDARLRIVDERDASLEAFEQAKQALAEVEN